MSRGAYLIIEHTEALTRYRRELAETVPIKQPTRKIQPLEVNMIAAAEIARQLSDCAIWAELL